MKEFLPISQEDINARGWEQIDFLFISGDAYVDHPSFGPAVICRVLEAQGYKVVWQCLFQVEILIRCFATILRLKNQEKKMHIHLAERWGSALIMLL